MRVVMMDVDGVLVGGRPTDGSHLFTDLEKDLGIARDHLQQAFFTRDWPEIVTGRKPIEPALTAALSAIGSPVSAETLLAYWFENDSRIDTAVLAAMDALRADGTRVFLATNQEHRRASYLMNQMNLAAHTDGIIYSAALGYRKPAPQFYEQATIRAGVPAANIVLIDDTQENIHAAKAFGWQAIHWQKDMTVEEELSRLTR